MKRVLALAAAIALAGAGSPAHALVVEVSFTASEFVGITGAGLTGEEPPQAELSGSFTIDTETGVRDVPDFVTQGIQDDLVYEVLSVYSTPTAGQIEIAGYGYPQSDLASYLGFTNGQLDMILVSGRAQGPEVPTCIIQGQPEVPWSCSPAQFVTAGTNDFLLGVYFPSILGEGEKPSLVYTTTAHAGSFGAQSLRATVSLDGGEPFEFVLLPPGPVEGATLCSAARPSGGGSATLEAGARPGTALCEEAPTEAARSASGGRALREARLAAPAIDEPRLASGMRLQTALGTHRLDAKKADRLLLAASKGASAAVTPPASDDALRCAGVKAAPGSRRFRMRGVPVAEASGTVAHFDVGRPTRVCADAEEGGGEFVCYRARRAAGGPRQQPSRVWVAHALGLEHLKVTRALELCLPALEVD